MLQNKCREKEMHEGERGSGQDGWTVVCSFEGRRVWTPSRRPTKCEEIWEDSGPVEKDDLRRGNPPVEKSGAGPRFGQRDDVP